MAVHIGNPVLMHGGPGARSSYGGVPLRNALSRRLRESMRDAWRPWLLGVWCSVISGTVVPWVVVVRSSRMARSSRVGWTVTGRSFRRCIASR